MNFLSLGEKKFGEIGAVLPRDAGDERSLDRRVHAPDFNFLPGIVLRALRWAPRPSMLR